MIYRIWLCVSLLMASAVCGVESSTPSVPIATAVHGSSLPDNAQEKRELPLKETGKASASTDNHTVEDSGGDKKDSVRTDVPKGLPSQVIPPTYVLNEVRAIVYGPASTALILTLDIKPTLERRPRNLRNLVLEELMLIEARKMKMPITEEDVDRNLKQIQKLANYTMEQITQLFATLGYSLKDSDLAQDKQFIRRKRPGDIVLVEPEGNGYEVTKLVSRIHERNKPFRSGDPDVDNEREMSIKRILGEQRFNKLKRDYEEELLEKAHIVFTYEADRKEVYSPRK